MQRHFIRFCVLALTAACGERATPISSRSGRAAYDSMASCDGGACHADYNGGKVVPNAKVYVVLWTTAVTPYGNLGDYYQAVTNSGYLDWLNEYNTTIIIPHGLDAGWPGTNQIIGRGTYAGTITITPSAANAGGTAICAGTSSANCCPASLTHHGSTCVADQQIQNELNAQIIAGTLPPPDLDALYVTYFPPGVFIYDSTPTGSCYGGGFCGYHGTFKNADREFYYGVLPDHGPGSGCDIGCGPTTPACTASNLDQCFANLGSTSGHELAEAITDPEVGIAGNGPAGPPLAWYDDLNGEVGDMCGGTGPDAGTGTGVIGGFTVQDIWSNLAGQCIVTRNLTNTPSVTADFAVAFKGAAARPNAVTVAAGDLAGAVVPVDLPATVGTAQPLMLSVPTILPAGLHAVLNKTSVNSGDNTVTLTVTADSGTANQRDFVIAVQAADLNNIHSAGLLVQVANGTGYDFSLDLTPKTRIIQPGSNASFTVTTAPLAGSTSDSIALSLTPALPAGVTASFSPASVGLAGTSTLTFTAGPAATTGAFDFTVTAAAPGRTRSIAASAFFGPSFTLSISPGSRSVPLAGQVVYTVTSAVTIGSPEAIALAIDGLPPGVTGSFSPATMTAGSSSTLTLAAAANAAVASATQFAVTGTAPSSTVVATAQVSVVTGNDFALALSPAAITVQRGGAAQLTISATLAAGSPEAISLSTSGLPAGVTATLTPSSITAGQTSTLALSASSTAALATSLTLSITGTAPSASHAAIATLAVAEPPTVAITHPAAGATVAGTVAIEATASPGAGATLVKVHLLVDGAVVATVPGSPAQGFWHSTESAEGPHTLTARALDSNGGSMLSAPVTVTTHNGGTAKRGGCSSGGASLSALLGLLVLAARRRRSRLLLSAPALRPPPVAAA